MHIFCYIGDINIIYTTFALRFSDGGMPERMVSHGYLCKQLIYNRMQSLISFFARYKEQYRQNLILALPVVLTQLGQIFTQVVDNLMVGHYGGSEP